MMTWAHAGPSVAAAFLASLVEFIEALTVVLAVGVVRGWRPALLGTGLGLGTLLLLFGLRWLRKAILRAAGIIPLHDEEAAFSAETAHLRQGAGGHMAWDWVAIGAAFKIVMLEGIEVVFIVIAIGAAGGLLVPASAGAIAALLVVTFLGVILHRPLAKIPENALKFTVGVLLCAFGAFWVGEGIGVVWPAADWSILSLIAGFLAVGLLSVPLCRGRARLLPTER
jgi:uncharacterized membrane protein